MKKIIAYLVINTSVPPENPDKVAGVFWAKRNAKNYAWQLNAEGSDANSTDSFVVEKYWFAPKRSVTFEPN
jgi:hypothetical protein